VTNGRHRATVHLEAGQLPGSVRFLAGKWQWSDKRVQRFLAVLKRDQLVTTETTTGQTIITLCNWGEDQRPFAAATTQTATQSTTQTTTKKKELKELNKNTRVAKGEESKGLCGKEARTKSYSEGFLLFWETYPRKDAKQAAARAYGTVIKYSVIREPDLLAKTKAFAASWAARPAAEHKFIPHAATWLNGRRFKELDGKATEPLSADNLTDEQWQLYVKLFRQGSTQWPDYLGPAPGKHGCRVPPHLLIAPVQEAAIRTAATPIVRSVQQQGSAT
jgi:DNA-binding transcriptional regulator YhcF (GntR family)